jgi:hypothetical protein
MVPYLVVKNQTGRRRLHGKMEFRGLPVSIENAKSSSRQWHNPHNNTSGITRFEHPYGYFRGGCIGMDGDATDCFIGPNREAETVFIITQTKAPDFVEIDEQKIMLGWDTEEEAKAAYLNHYSEPRFFHSILAMPFEEFKEKLASHKGRMIKSHIQAYTRTTETGKTVFVAQHEDKRRVYIPDNSKQRSSHDNDPVIAPSGRDNFGSIQGEIAAKIGLPPGPIKLLQGKQFGEHSGFGKAHMHEQHGAEIRAAGFKDEEAFVADVLKNYTAIYDAGGGRYALVSDGMKQKIHILEISRNKVPPFYSIVTGYITDRPKFTERNFKLLWKKGGLKKGGEEMCKQVGDELGVDWKEVDFDEFADGMFDEDEHGKGAKATAQIVLDHLKEDPKYYTKLKAAGLAKAFPLFIIRREEKCSWLQ